MLDIYRNRSKSGKLNNQLGEACRLHCMPPCLVDFVSCPRTYVPMASHIFVQGVLMLPSRRFFSPRGRNANPAQPFVRRMHEMWSADSVAVAGECARGGSVCIQQSPWHGLFTVRTSYTANGCRH